MRSTSSLFLVGPSGAWRANTFASIVSAAGRQGDVAQDWILRVEAADPSELEYAGEGWVSLDRKLAAALTNIANGELGRQITQATTTALSNNMVARGRVLHAIIFGTTRLETTPTCCMI